MKTVKIDALSYFDLRYIYTSKYVCAVGYDQAAAWTWEDASAVPKILS